MKITVINGSPKGKYSITLQTVRYLEKCFPEDTFEIIHAGQKIHALEKDFSSIINAVRDAELILFSYPVYTFLAPSQLHRFIELLKESGVDLSGKFATQITTSKHFYDVTAHRYIQENCQDLGMKSVTGLSADMDDLLTKKGQQQAEAFWKYVQWSVAQDCYETTGRQPERETEANRPEGEARRYETKDCPAGERKSHGAENQTAGDEKSGDVVIITDAAPEDTGLREMIRQFRQAMPRRTRVLNLRKFPFTGGCLGCFHCAVSGKCIYKDGFDRFLRTRIQRADAIVYAFTIRDHSMGARFKMYDDRQFCNGHRTVTMGMPMGYLVSGSYHSEPNLQMVIEARAQVGGNFLAGVASEEGDTGREISRLASSLEYALTQGYQPPQNFYGVGGMKIFRDLIYLMQGMMKADHAFYKAHKQYDFPQKKVGTLLKMYAVGALISSPKLQSKMGNKMNEGMLMPYEKVINKAGENGRILY